MKNQATDSVYLLHASFQKLFFDASGNSISEDNPPGPAVPNGWYEVTICVSLKDLDLDSISRITFQVERMDATGRLNGLVK